MGIPIALNDSTVLFEGAEVELKHQAAGLRLMGKVEVVHVTSPLCHWSWGYEPIMNRLEATYGKQVRFTVALALPYVQREKWLEDYGMGAEEAIQWARDDILPKIRMPVLLPSSWSGMPESCLPATIAVHAAGLVHGPAAARRLTRDLMFAAFVEGQDTSQDKVLEEIVARAGLDNARMVEAAKTDAVDRAMEDDAQRAGHGGNFYSILVRDGQDDGSTTVSLAHAYDAARVERAIDYMAGRKLKKKRPSDIEAYVAKHGNVCAEEVSMAFATTTKRARDALARLEKRGAIERVATPAALKSKFYKAAA
jgi:predicted DsbA family dithiol-disulfide isomerase